MIRHPKPYLNDNQDNFNYYSMRATKKRHRYIPKKTCLKGYDRKLISTSFLKPGPLLAQEPK